MSNSHIGKEITQYFFDKYNKPSDLNLDLTQACNLEEERMAAYHGRELLELIQNVDDAYLELCDKDISKIGQEVKCKIEYKSNILTILNTGTHFTTNTINRLCQGGVSSKSGKYIGNKGTGFRSVLNWAKDKSIEIHSGDFHIRFSKEYADKQFTSMKNEAVIQKQIIQRQIEQRPDLYFPILSAPEDILNDNIQTGFDTTIKIEIDSKTQNDKHGILDQIDEFDSNIKIFLQTITEIEFSTDKFTKNFNKKYVNKNIVTITKNGKNELKRYLLFNNYDNPPLIQHENEEKGKEIRLSIAIPLKDEADAGDDEYKLYCFFPIREAVCPFPAILHATFLLNQSRDSIITDALNINKKVVQELLKFYVYIVEKEIAKKQYNNLAVKLLTPNTICENDWKFASDFGKFNVENYYLDLLKDKKFLQTVNNEYIAIIDNPKLIISVFPDFFKEELFNKLLKWQNYEEHDKLIRSLAARNNIDLSFSAKELFEIINTITNGLSIDLSIKQRVEAFAWWQDNFGSSEYLPNLLKDDNNNWLQYSEEYFFLSGQQLKIPHWVKNPLLNKEYQTELFDYYKNDPDIKNSMDNSNDPIDRVLARSGKIKSVDFKYSDHFNIILSVNSSVRDNYQHSIEFIEWLWKNYYSEDDSWSPPSGSPDSPINYRFPTIAKTVQNSKTLFFGKEYKNDIANYLFAAGEYKEFPPVSTFKVNDDEKEQFQNFIAKFGVLNYPKIEDDVIEDPEDGYKNIIMGMLKSLDARYLSTRKWKLKHIKNLQNIFLNSPNYTIIKWILQDEIFHNALKDSYSGNIEYKFGQEWYYGNYTKNIPNYFIHIIRNTKWLEINGQKLSPNECLNFGRNTNKFSELLPVIQEDYFNGIAIKCNTTIQQVKEIFEIFALSKKITDLPSHIFYSLLLKLPENDVSGDLIKIIYREIESPEFNKEFDDCEEKTKYFKEGEVFVRQGNTRIWHKASDSYFPSTRIINTDKFPIIDKPQRSGNFADYQRVFGVQEYSDNYNIIEHTAKLSNGNNDLQRYLKDFIRFVKPFGEKNENIKKLVSSLSIQLVQNITIEERNTLSIVNTKYTLLRSSATKWFIVAEEFNINELSKQIEIIFENIANTSGSDSFINQIGELFRTKEAKDRDFLIIKEFGTLDVLSDNIENNSIKLNFEEIVKIINKNYDLSRITIDWGDFDLYENLRKIIDILTDIKVDISDFQDKGFMYQINLIPYYKTEIRNQLNAKKHKFETKLYNEFINKGVVEIKNFQQEINKYNDFEAPENEIKNSIYFDINKFCESKFSFESNDIINIHNMYNENYAKFSNGRDNKLLVDFFNDNEIKSLLYFYDIEIIATKLNENFKNYAVKVDNENVDMESTNESSFDINSINSGTIVNEELTFIETEADTKNKNHLAFSDKQSQKEQKRNKVIGDKGELIAYKNLFEQYKHRDDIKIVPKAKVFVEKGIIKPGQADDSFGCDIVVEFSNGKYDYYEIKTGNNEFYLSPGEIDLAKKNMDNYHLWFITDSESDSPKIHNIDSKFINKAKPIIEKYKCQIVFG